jgi:Mg-chelatase subunit ChlD
MTMVAALVLALAGTSLNLPERRVATVFIVDVSDSISSSAVREAEGFVRAAIEEKPPEAWAAVVAFGREARVELSLQQDPELHTVASRPDPTRSDLARALRLAAALMPEGMRRRVVLISDGRENSGDVRAEAARVLGKGIEVDTVALSDVRLADAAVVDIDAPIKVREGDRFEIEATISANTEGPATVTFWRGDTVILEKDQDLTVGDSRITVEEVAAQVGAVTYRVDIRASRDGVPHNDSGAALVLVQGPPVVTVVEAEEDEGEQIEKALTDRGFVVERVPLERFPTAQELLATESVVLVDVAANQLTQQEVAILKGFVQELGRGLVTVGGESSWSLGGYLDSSLEELLPLTSEIKDPERRPAIAQVLTVDVSGSMQGGAGGVSKIDISKSAALQAFRTLTEHDEIGVLAFDTGSSWVLDLQPLPDEATIREGLERLQPGGGTDIVQAVNASVEGLRETDAALKHIVLITDGLDFNNLTPSGQYVKDQGMTLSIIAIGDETGLELPAMANAAGGRYYQGRDLSQIPEILIEEVQIASRRYVNEGEFYPTVASASASTSDLRATPPLLGYIGTSPKPSASVLLAIGEYDDPLLATWRTGLGVVSSWTSDAKGRWARNWVSWEGFADFWSSVVRETIPASAAPGYSARALPTDEGLEIIVESEDRLPEGTEARARVVDPFGRVERIDLSRTGVNSFAGTLISEEVGAYLVGVEVEAEGRSLYRDTVGAIRSYSAEYRPSSVDSTLLGEVAIAGGGSFAISPTESFDPAAGRGTRSIEITWWLMLLAALLLPFDVALRRVLLSREDFRIRAPQQRETTRTRWLESLLRSRAESQTSAKLEPREVPDRPASKVPQKEVAVPPTSKTEVAQSGSEHDRVGALDQDEFDPEAEEPAPRSIGDLAKERRERREGP